MPQALKPQGGIDGIEAFLKVQAELRQREEQLASKETGAAGDWMAVDT